MMLSPQFHDRFTRMTWPQQIGNLASTLARIASRATSPQYDELVGRLLREAAILIEWSATYVPHSLLFDLAPLQRELLLWRRLWPQTAPRDLLALQARNYSDRLLRLADLG